MNSSINEYRCAAGESWDSVALKIYGDERYAADLMQANPAMCVTIIFTGGEVLTLPTIERAKAGQQIYTPANAPWRS